MAFYRGSRSGATLRDHNDHVNADHDDYPNDDNDDDGDDCDYDDGVDEEGEALIVSLFIIGAANCDYDTRLKIIPMWMIMMLPAQMMKMMPRTHKLSL